jgi:radical SAM enzyme (TIGR01210 family)
MSASLSVYPASAKERDAWIVARRGSRNIVDPLQPYAFTVEEERSASGEVVPVATVFLANRECPWRCLMCDLWRNTLTEGVPPGAISLQIDYALKRLPPARQIKLYNSGSFFDARAIPPQDHAEIAARVATFEQIIVECHPALVGDACFHFRDRLTGRLEVAMGLETVHPEILERLNKRMTTEHFASAARRLRSCDVDLRVFVLVKPPFMEEADALEWADRSIDFAFECGANVVTLIPTRSGNGAMEELAATGQFSPPHLATLEAAAAYGIALNKGRVFSDLWDLRAKPECADCHERRVARLHTMNLRQIILPPIKCDQCGENRG